MHTSENHDLRRIVVQSDPIFHEVESEFRRYFLFYVNICFLWLPVSTSTVRAALRTLLILLQINLQPFGHSFKRLSRNRVPFMVVQQSKANGFTIEPPDGHCRRDQRPAAISVGSART
jgi:hypothetical protein